MQRGRHTHPLGSGDPVCHVTNFHDGHRVAHTSREGVRRRRLRARHPRARHQHARAARCVSRPLIVLIGLYYTGQHIHPGFLFCGEAGRRVRDSGNLLARMGAHDRYAAATGAVCAGHLIMVYRHVLSIVAVAERVRDCEPREQWFATRRGVYGGGGSRMTRVWPCRCRVHCAVQAPVRKAQHVHAPELHERCARRAPSLAPRLFSLEALTPRPCCSALALRSPCKGAQPCGRVACVLRLLQRDAGCVRRARGALVLAGFSLSHSHGRMRARRGCQTRAMWPT